MTGLSKYPKQVFWSDEDEGFIAIAPDLPGCSAIGDTEADALRELDDAITAWVDAAATAGNKVPAPSRPAAHSHHSGKLLVRMPRTLHQDLVDRARHENVSLNQFIIYVLARYSSVDTRNVTLAKPVYSSGVGSVNFVGGGSSLPTMAGSTSIEGSVSGSNWSRMITSSNANSMSSDIITVSSGTVTTVQCFKPARLGWDVEFGQHLDRYVMMSGALTESPLMLKTVQDR